MALTPNKKTKKPPSGSRVAAVVLFILIIGVVAGYYFISLSQKTSIPLNKPQIKEVKPVYPASSLPKDPNFKTESSSLPQQLNPKKNIGYSSESVNPKAKKTATGALGKAQLAIVIDDMGSSVSQARSLAAIKVPLTFAVIPGLRFDKGVVEYATAERIETIIHIPMQSKGWPEQRLEANGLLVSMNSDEIEKRVSGFIQRFPGAVGVNNHMGSEFTEQEGKMTVVLQMLKKNNLFYIDSVTSPSSLGMEIAAKKGIKTARRNVFLDNKQERDYILGQLNQAVRLAKKNGSAIAICHPHPSTIAVLVSALPELESQGVQLVPVSQLVK